MANSSPRTDRDWPAEIQTKDQMRSVWTVRRKWRVFMVGFLGRSHPDHWIHLCSAASVHNKRLLPSDGDEICTADLGTALVAKPGLQIRGTAWKLRRERDRLVL